MGNGDPIASIEAEWAFDDGFLWKAREGKFDAIGFERTRQKLQSVNDRAARFHQ
jgi:hypothetical protein